ncbi:MAG: hypothetical protein IKX14_03960 [Neisseriaceae bacterium]|nr:hypothetical protein [Neisseriaceae bacterium]
MKNLITITALCLSLPTMAADFCMKYQKDIQKEEQKFVQQSVPNMLTFQAIKCHNNVLEYYVRSGTPDKNRNTLQSKDTTAMQEKFCANPSIQNMARNGLEKIVYIFNNKNNQMVDKLELSLVPCR